jgi:signal transduction histidine kinase
MDEETGLRRVARRLALSTVALMFLMLLVLEVIVFLFTQHTLQTSLQATLRDRVHPAVGFVDTVYDHDRDETGGTGRGIVPPEGKDRDAAEASTVFVDRRLTVVSANGRVGSTVLDRAALVAAIRSGRDQCCSTRSLNRVDYLIYAAPVRLRGRVVGGVESAISEYQYEHTLQVLLWALILVSIVGLAISGAISVLVARRALTPIRLSLKRQRDFVADAAHELRTPLSIMRTAGEVGINASSMEEQQQTIEQMLVENQHLTRLVDDLSLLARADAEAITIEHAPVDLARLVTDTAEEILPLAEEREIHLTADVQGSTVVAGDILRLRQLLLILTDNALKHTPAGGSIIMSLRVAGSRVRLQVMDSGPGIAPADLPHLFDRFYRSDRARAGEGTGLGLAIGRWIAEAHGGTITAGNRTEGGAVFTVLLPARSVQQPEASLSVDRKAGRPAS